MRRALVLFAATMMVAGCDAEPDEGTPPVQIPQGDAGPDPDQGPLPDMAEPDPDAAAPDPDAAAPDPDAAPPPQVDICEALGLEKRAFIAEGAGLKFGDRAGDFTVQTLDGEWTLSEEWSGCESYVFLNYFYDVRADQSTPWDGDQLFESPLELLIQESPRNVRYFFVSYEQERADRVARMTGLRDAIAERSRQLLGEEESAFWMARMHFITERSLDMGGSAGEFFTSYLRYTARPENRVDLGDRGQAPPPLPNAFAIDRNQRWDPVGSLSEFVGSPPNFVMAAFPGHFYNYHADLLVRLRDEADSTTVVSVLDGFVTDRVLTRTVTLPDADEMAAFDTVAFDVGVTCHHQNPFGCSEWDRIARITWCADPECGEGYEVVRWITPYWRRGHRRWIMDASPFLPLMAAGGEQTFRVEMGPGWERATEREVNVSVRLSTQGTGVTADVMHAFSGGDFGANYNDREPFTFTPAADAEKVELVVIVSGHGQTEQDNCAEWCDHRHHFTVNDTELDEIRSQPGIGQLRTCALRANEGVSPGQWGNWAPGRAYWCPGLPVETMRIDITDQVNLGVENTISYRASLGGQVEPRGGSMSLNVYVAWGTE